MKKLTLLLLLMISSNVFAEWTRVTVTNDGDMTFYIDFETIKRKGNKVKTWELADSKTVQKYRHDRYLSTIQHYEYDCEEGTTRALDWYLYSGNMRKGELVDSDTNIKNEAESTIPGSINETILKLACDKK